MENPLEPLLGSFVQERLDEAVSAVERVRAARLEGYAYCHLPAGHPSRAHFKSAYLTQELRHRQIKARLLPLLRSWREAGIGALLFKGFALAEFVYRTPGERFYGDVDVLVRPDQAARAAEIARRLGWLERWNRYDSITTHTHEASHLYTPDGLVRLDLHLQVLQLAGPDWAGRRRFTEATWQGSQLQPWEDLNVHLMQPVDALLIGLLLNRRWGDRWGIKPSDLPDARALAGRFGLVRGDLERRAGELGCTRTLGLLLERCDPWENRVSLALPSPRQRLRWEIETMGELGIWWLERRFGQFLRLPGVIADVLRELPGLLRVLAGLRRHSDLYGLLWQLERPPRTGPESSGRRRERILRGVNRGLWLLGLRKNPCVPRALALYVALRAEGLPVEFVSGVRRVGDRLEGHAWVELEGLPLEGSGEEQAPRLFKESFRYPPRSSPQAQTHV
ncbi:MAG TPA: lasso peptide biosynthesis B2 protein [Meiothermus sp.]|nr:lasso peptide biosynthesis B2 protein [Meiothermus sp.]